MELEVVCIGRDGSAYPVVVTAGSGHRVADLAQALCDHVGASLGQLYLETTRLPDRLPLTEAALTDGALIGLGGPVRPFGSGLTGGEAPELAVVGGLHGGQSVALYAGHEVRVGRAHGDLALADVEVSREHAAVSVTEGGVLVRDTGSRNGIRWRGWRLDDDAELSHGDVVGLGETVLGVRSVVLADADLGDAPSGNRRRFNRPPRITAPDRGDELVVPVEPRPPGGFRFPWLTVLLPMALGGALYLFVPNAGYFLLIMLLSPLMIVANLIGDRRSGRREYTACKKEYEQALEVFEGALAAACLAEQRRVREQHPDPSWLVSVACAPSARLWERRRADADFLRLRLGLHDRPAEVRLRFDPRGARRSGDDLPELPLVSDVPATVDLRDVGVLGIAAPRQGLLSAARALVVQATALHAPKDLAIVVLTGRDEAADWEWVTWLPHTRPRSSAFRCLRLVGTDASQVETRLAELRAELAERTAQQRVSLRQGRPAGREILVVVDGARRLRGLPGLVELLAVGPAAGLYALCLDADETALPDECGATLVATNPLGTRARLSRTGGLPLQDVLVDGVRRSYASQLALSLAPVDTLGSSAEEQSLPERVRFTELAELELAGEPDGDAELVQRVWAATDGGRCTRALLGVGPSGPLTVDLRRDGPHGLIAGTSGSGKSELLQTLVASLALANTPDALTFVLVDYKGGSAFAACAELPHCVGLVTDLDGHLVGRALDSLSAELRRRETLLAETGAKDIEDYWARTGARLPRLVIVVDEFASLVEEVPDFVPGVVGIGMRGRSLGVHVVLATQRPGGVVTADMRANLNLRISLRVTADSESVDVIDAPDAARITARQPGRAHLRTGHGELTGFQAARIGWPRTAEVDRSAEPVTIRPRIVDELGRPPRAEASTSDVDADGCTDLSVLVAATKVAADRLGVSSPPRPWLPPLPALITVAELPAGSGTSPTRVRLGLADRPSAQAQDAFEIDLDRTGPVAVGGGGRTGRSTVLRTLAAGLAGGAGPDTVHLYAVDCGNRAMAALAELPHTGAVVDADDPVRLTRLLDWLTGEIERRQRVLAAGGHADLAEQRAAAAADDRLPHVIVLLDRLEGFLSTFADRDSGRLVDVLEGLLRRGPAVGVITVFSTDRTAFGHRIAAAVEHRLVLRQADRDDVTVFGLSPRDVPTRMPAGRAIWAATGEEVQVALLDPDPSGSAQALALRRLAAQVGARSDGLDPALLPRRIDPLPERITTRELDALRRCFPGAAAVCTPAAGGDHLGPLDVDLTENGGTFVVAGPGRSGRSTALTAIVRSLVGRTTGELPVVLVAPRPSPLRELLSLPGVLGLVAGRDPAELDELLLTAGGKVAVVVDDAEMLDELSLGESLQGVVRDCRDTGSVLVAAATTEDMLLNRYRGWLAQARRSRSGLLLNPASQVDGEVFEVRLPRSIGGGWPPGRGLLVRRGETVLAQVPVEEGSELP